MAGGDDGAGAVITGPSGMADWGFVDDAELERIVVVSPHLDDAVLSCGQVLAAHPGATVVSVFTGTPAAYPDPPGWWSRLCGFGPGDDVMAVRKDEDLRALAELGAEHVWLDFVEAHFDPDAPVPSTTELADRLDEALRGLHPTLVLLPFGLANPEHVATHDAGLVVRARWVAASPGGAGPVAWCCYEDLGYHQIPGQLAWRVATLFKAGLWPTPAAMPTDPSTERKRAALACYESQLRGLEADWRLARRLDAPTPEQIWRLAPPPSGWEAMIDLVP
ncbi:MAG: PIG-L family deacetylase [Acidimicrobiales bacterium]